MSLRIILILNLLLLVGCRSANQTELANKQVPQEDICLHYDWNKVEQLVSPHLDDFLMTALTMQGQSSNYNTSNAAIQARGDIKDAGVIKILDKIIAANCQ